MPLPPSLQYIFIHCGTNNIGHNDPEVISDGLTNLARVIKKKYRNVKIIKSSLLPRNKANSQKRSLLIATNIYLKEAYKIHLVLLNWTLNGSLEAPSTRCFSKIIISIS